MFLLVFPKWLWSTGTLQSSLYSKAHCQAVLPFFSHFTSFGVWWLSSRRLLSSSLLACSWAAEQMELSERGLSTSVETAVKWLVRWHIQACSPWATKWHLSFFHSCKVSSLKWHQDFRIDSESRENRNTLRGTGWIYSASTGCVLFEDVLRLERQFDLRDGLCDVRYLGGKLVHHELSTTLLHVCFMYLDHDWTSQTFAPYRCWLPSVWL